MATGLSVATAGRMHNRSAAWMILMAAGCAHAPAATLAPTTAGPLLASLSPGGSVAPSAQQRYDLAVTMTTCWYPAPANGTAADAAPRGDPRHCRTISERVVIEAGDADALRRVERLTIEDVALKFEGAEEEPAE